MARSIFNYLVKSRTSKSSGRHTAVADLHVHQILFYVSADLVLRSSPMTWKIIKLVSVIMSLVGIVWFAGGQHGFVLGGLLFFLGIGLFIVCRIFEPTIIKSADRKQ